MVEIASGHHSHYDGNGYGGRGHTEGETPSLETCIVSVADAFDAMTTTRSYRQALSVGTAMEELKKNRGSQFDPAIDFYAPPCVPKWTGTDNGGSTTETGPVRPRLEVKSKLNWLTLVQVGPTSVQMRSETRRRSPPGQRWLIQAITLTSRLMIWVVVPTWAPSP